MKGEPGQKKQRLVAPGLHGKNQKLSSTRSKWASICTYKTPSSTARRIKKTLKLVYTKVMVVLRLDVKPRLPVQWKVEFIVINQTSTTKRQGHRIMEI